jgi:hypothetical protein
VREDDPEKASVPVEPKSRETLEKLACFADLPVEGQPHVEDQALAARCLELDTAAAHLSRTAMYARPHEGSFEFRCPLIPSVVGSDESRL